MQLGDQERFVFRFMMGVVGLLVAAAVLGFIVVPTVQGQRGPRYVDVGLPCVGIAPTRRLPQRRRRRPSGTRLDVAWTTCNMNALARPNRQVAQDLAQNLCSACHGETGVSPAPDFPHLSGRSALAIYKQLHDYKSGARANPQMSPVAQQLNEEQMLAMANHYATLARGTLDRRLDWTADPETDRLVRTGEKARGIPVASPAMERRRRAHGDADAVRPAPGLSCSTAHRLRPGPAQKRRVQPHARYRLTADAAGDRRAGKVLRGAVITRVTFPTVPSFRRRPESPAVTD